MPNFLDLRDKIEPQIVIVEKVVLKPRSFFGELFKVFAVIVIVSASVWGVSHADNLIDLPSLLNSESINLPNETKTITGIYGTVTSISTSTLTLDNSQGSKYKGVDVFTVDFTNLKEVHTNANGKEVPVSLSVSDLRVGDKITARGFIAGSNIDTETIINFSIKGPRVNEEIVLENNATSTEESASTTEATSTTTTTSVGSIIGDIIQTVIDTLTGTSTATITPETATTTEPTVTTEATSTLEVVIPPAPEPDPTPETPNEPALEAVPDAPTQ